MFRSRTKAIGWKPRKKVAGPEMQGTRYWRIRIPHAPALPFMIADGSYNVFFFFWTTNPLPLSLDNITPFTGKTTKT